MAGIAQSYQYAQSRQMVIFLPDNFMITILALSKNNHCLLSKATIF